jgi:hypothetical protein
MPEIDSEPRPVTRWECRLMLAYVTIAICQQVIRDVRTIIDWVR